MPDDDKVESLVEEFDWAEAYWQYPDASSFQETSGGHHIILHSVEG